VKVDSTITLVNGTKMPRLGLGVYQIPNGLATYQDVIWAFKAGYRHIDTAAFYRNESSVGKAVRESEIPRENIWVTTKLWPTDQLNPEKAFQASLDNLGLDYVDLYLVHFPVPGLVTKTWKAMETIYNSGRTKAIGISNFSVKQMEDVLKIANIPPTVNQVRCSPYNFDKSLYDFCKEHDIAFEAYSPLTQGRRLNDPVLAKVAKKHHKTTAQILIGWALQKDMIVIPKSEQKNRIIENADVFDFELSDSDMKVLDGLSI
jgi:diketogulonate reductase-like aldo/keto reductase